jgi:hypothetical protein
MIRIKRHLESGTQKTDIPDGERKTELSLRLLAQEFLLVWCATWRKKDFKETS